VPPVSDALLFWLIAAAMVALALGFVLPGLLGRRAPPEGARRVETNAAIYRSALADLARERAKLRGVEREAAKQRQVGESHDAETDLSRAQRGALQAWR